MNTEIEINGADAYIALMKALRSKMQFDSMFATMDGWQLMFANFNRQLLAKGYTEEQINTFHDLITNKVIKNEIE